MNDSKQKKPVVREEWIEWLRLVSMLWIILFHFSDHGSINMNEAALGGGWIILAFARLGGGIGNCTFALISGYLLYSRKRRWSRIVCLWLEIEFYSVISFLLANIFHMYNGDGVAELVRNFIPISGIRYWYASVYMLIYLLHPLFDWIIDGVSYKEHVFIVGIIFYFCVFVPTISGAETFSSGGGVEIFILMYFIGALIKKYDVFKGSATRYYIVFLIIISLMCASEIILKVIPSDNSTISKLLVKLMPSGEFTYFVWPMRKLPVVIAAVTLFVATKKSVMKIPQILMAAAQSTFGVYLLHIGSLHELIFQKLFNITDFYGKFYFGFILLVYAVILFAICIITDQLRIRYIEKHTDLIVKRILKAD